MADWSAIHSFKLQLKDGVTWLKGQDIEFAFHMKAPELGELAGGQASRRRLLDV
ncbi:MAG: hypothetical protein SOW20_01580 [Berryella intestinalis]|uniref:hypothetical protein n=1 Tax=Berryella intestinalis TaxID=1531429 RepID=UPI002A4EE513|nr:hypothetical protein [Berryella intestinalis]MDD7369321.1 hypothetical protein [Berryella intestinalis]MDY3128705.1 hypothetical protein [Berryella intestinalis]